MSRAARLHLGRDPAFATLIGQIGPCTLRIDRTRSPYEALVRAVAHQQLHARAAAAMLARLSALCAVGDIPAPELLLSVGDTPLRACGFSATKIAALRDIAARTIDGTVPTRRTAMRLSDAALIKRLTIIRGVGRWTVEMILISTLGRPDVLPVDDFGVREGYRLMHALDKQPSPRAMSAIGEAWSPHRSIAAWYLWRYVDAVRAAAQA